MTEDKDILTPTKHYIKLRITINPDSFDKKLYDRLYTVFTNNEINQY